MAFLYPTPIRIRSEIFEGTSESEILQVSLVMSET